MKSTKLVTLVPIKSHYINDLSFPKHNNKGKRHVMMAYNSEIKIEKDKQKAPINKPYLDRMAQEVNDLFKF